MNRSPADKKSKKHRPTLIEKVLIDDHPGPQWLEKCYDKTFKMWTDARGLKCDNDIQFNLLIGQIKVLRVRIIKYKNSL